MVPEPAVPGESKAHLLPGRRPVRTCVPLPPRSGFVQPCAAAPAGASRLQSLRPVRRVAELGSLGTESA